MPSFTVFKGSEDGKIVESQTKKSDKLEGDHVYMRVTASGLCGTDLHYKTTDMGLGHEGVGVVEEVGPEVRSLKKGDRVGWSYNHDSCGECMQCMTGKEILCAKRAMYGYADLDQGSMASHAVWREKFLFRIPDEISDADAAPLMCGGATVFGALYGHGVEPLHRVGIIGVGGLGHLAIQFAAAMGCEVVVLSGTDSKKDQAMKLGANEFYAMKGKDKLDIGRPLDHLVVTTSVPPQWDLLIPVLAPSATIYPLTVADGNFEFPHMAMLANELRIQGSIVASNPTMVKMLHFAAQHKIRPVNMEFPMTVSGIEEAMKTLEDGKMRYRGVLLPSKA